MHPEAAFRLAGALLLVALAAFALPHRLRAHRAGGTPSRRDEGALFLPLRLAGAVAYGAAIAWMIRPESVAFALMPVPAGLRWAGAALAAASGVLVVWVFRTLGLNLTDTVVVRARHTLVTWGPYAVVRHPLYAALVPHVVGFTLLSANALVALGGAVAAVLIGRRTRIEEAKLVERYGETYRAYARRTPRYVPRFGRPATVVLIAAALAGCASGTTAKREGPLKVTCTIGMVADAAREIGREHVAVTGLMGPGVDPHLYKASEGDIEKLSGADVILYNGLNLEGKMGDLLVRMSRSRATVPVTEAIPESLLREPPEFLGHYDPHVWFDVSMWRHAAARVRDALAEADPAHAADFTRNAEAYLDSLEALDGWVKEAVGEVPRARRVLVTAHDAFGYFGRAYDVDVVGLQGISTVSEYGLADVRRLVTLITSRGVKAVFIESSVPRRSIDAVVEGCRARGHAVAIGGTLYSDAMGPAGTPDGTYMGMVRANVHTIVAALR